METLSTWWSALKPLTQWFYAGSVFFSVLFLWQLIATFIGLAGDHDVDVHSDVAHDLSADAAHGAAHTDGHDGDHHATVSVFKLLSLRSVLAFATLFSWAGALYLDTNVEPGWAVFYASLWGLLALVLVAVMLNVLPRMSDTGNISMATAIDAIGTVHLDIPKKGEGEIRVLVSGVQTHVRAHTKDGEPIKAGASVRVVRLTSPNTVEVEPVPALKA
jgi:membrane protein implicated in regulation of membrane protease activity